MSKACALREVFSLVASVDRKVRLLSTQIGVDKALDDFSPVEYKIELLEASELLGHALFLINKCRHEK